MTRYAIVILITLLFTGIEKLNNSRSKVKSQDIVSTYVVAKDVATEHLQHSAAECCSLLSTHGATTNISVRIGSHSNNIVRHRQGNNTKQTIHISPCRHRGHVTDIFNFNQHRSSLRVVYYLHTLCRLRI